MTKKEMMEINKIIRLLKEHGINSKQTAIDRLEFMIIRHQLKWGKYGVKNEN